jgi:hypothetical protein
MGTSFCTHFKITAVALDKQEGQVIGKKKVDQIRITGTIVQVSVFVRVRNSTTRVPKNEKQKSIHLWVED